MNRRPSTVLVVCATIVIVAALVAVTLILMQGTADKDTVGIVVVMVGTLLTTLVGLQRTEDVKRTVDDLANGRMDSKIRAGVADVVAEHLIDDTVRDQLEVDRERPGDH